MDVTPMQIVDLMTIGASLNFGFLAFVQFRENLRLPVEAKIDIDLENTPSIGSIKRILGFLVSAWLAGWRAFILCF